MDGRILHCVLYVCFPFYFLSVHHFECYLLIYAILRLSSVVSTLLRYLSSEYAICCWGASVIIRPLRHRPCCSHFGSKSPKNGQMPLHPWSCYPRKGDESAPTTKVRTVWDGDRLGRGCRYIRGSEKAPRGERALMAAFLLLSGDLGLGESHGAPCPPCTLASSAACPSALAQWSGRKALSGSALAGLFHTRCSPKTLTACAKFRVPVWC